MSRTITIASLSAEACATQRYVIPTPHPLPHAHTHAVAAQMKTNIDIVAITNHVAHFGIDEQCTTRSATTCYTLSLQHMRPR